MTDIAKDDLLYVVGILIVLVPIAREIYISVTEKKKFPLLYCVIILIIAFALFYFGIDKTNRDFRTKNDLNDSLSSIKNQLVKSDSLKKNEAASMKSFLDTLQRKYNISRNTRNEPVFINHDKAVNVGTNKGLMKIKM